MHPLDLQPVKYPTGFQISHVYSRSCNLTEAVPFAWSALSSRPKSIPFHDNFLNTALLPMSPSSGLKRSLVLDMTHLVSLIPTRLSSGPSAAFGHSSIAECSAEKSPIGALSSHQQFITLTRVGKWSSDIWWFLSRSINDSLHPKDSAIHLSKTRFSDTWKQRIGAFRSLLVAALLSDSLFPGKETPW